MDKMDGIAGMMATEKSRLMAIEKARLVAERYKQSKTVTVVDSVVKTTSITTTTETRSNEDWFPPDACKICHGAGYLRIDVPFGHPDFGKFLPCQCKVAELKEHHQRTLVTTSGILGMKRYANASFGTFNLVEGTLDAFKKAMRFAEEPKGWLVLLGPNGCGKTLLEVAIARKRIEEGNTVMIQTAPSLLGALRDAFNPKSEETYSFKFQEMQDVDVLIVDDYGAENTTDWAKEKFFELLNYRYNSELPTVISSNDVSLASIDPRIRSRMNDIELVSIVRMTQARDYREYRDQN
jgi:DNA replication protein DnaC